MISPKTFYNALEKHGVSYFTGVPDSLLKAFCSYVTSHAEEKNHLIASNEGAAIGLAIGYHLSTGKIPLVYMQNSGLGNAINPLASLVDPKVYGIPLLLLVGWRGEPGVKDEPQHVKQGEITLSMLDTLNIPYSLIDKEEDSISEVVFEAVHSARDNFRAHAIVARKGCFEPFSLKIKTDNSFGWSREQAIKLIINETSKSDIIVATTGMASRELYEYRMELGHSHKQDFLTVGGMGHASQIALGIAYQKPEKQVICIDGDGAALMHMGSMVTNGVSQLSNFKHIILNNGAHDSVGGQPTAGFKIDIPQIACACGYKVTASCNNIIDGKAAIHSALQSKGPVALELKVDKGHRKELGRPKSTPIENKQSFMNFI